MKRLSLFTLFVLLAGCQDRSSLPRVTMLSPAGAEHQGAGYSPDGSRIYWWQRTDKGWQLWVSPADMSAPTLLPVTMFVPVEPCWSPDGTRFAIMSTATTPSPVVVVVDAARGTARRLTRGTAYEAPTSWSGDGSRVAYLTTVAGGAVRAFSAPADSGPPAAPVPMVPGEARTHFAVWSPDGKRMAINVLAQGQETIWFADSAGGHRTAMTTEGFEEIALHPWAPDGSALLYLSARTGAKDVWLLPADGGAPRQLTNDAREDDNARWSSDGKWIAFYSTRGLQSDLWVMPAAGGAPERVTDDPLVEAIIGWRPGTNELAYSTGQTRTEYWTYSLADGRERQITPDSLKVIGYQRRPGDQELLITIDRGGGVSDFALLPLAGGAPKIILRNVMETRPGPPPSWSPDGARIAFSSKRGGSSDLWVMAADGSGLTQLTTFPGSETEPSWSADGSTLFFRATERSTFGDIWRVAATGGVPTRITTQGNVVFLASQPWKRAEQQVITVTDQAGTFALGRLRSDGSVQALWDQSVVQNLILSPTFDSVAVTVSGAGGARRTMLLPLDGGKGRDLPLEGGTVRYWSPDGRQVVYSRRSGGAQDLYLLTLADGISRRLTSTPTEEPNVEWTADGATIVFDRQVPESRIVTADLSRVLARFQ